MSISPQQAILEAESLSPSAGRARVQSLDVFRGVAIAGMILANNPGDWGHVYAPLEHSPWNGCTPTDLVFPFFLFIVGVAIPFSLASRRQRLTADGWSAARQNRAILVGTLRRAAMLFGLGMLLYAMPINLQGPIGRGILDPSTLRIPGVLQRIALCYLAAALLAAYLHTWARAGIVALLLIGYTLLMRLVPVPGFGAGVLTAEGSLASYLDRLLLGRHCYKPHYDPEGLLSTLPAIATALIGVFAGEWLRTARSGHEKASGLLAFGVVGSILGYAADGLLLPINKPLWTGSYVLYTGGLALLGFGLCYWIVDVQRRGRWATPFKIMGVNAITIFLLSGLIGRFTLLIKVTGVDGKGVYLKTWLFEHLYMPLTRAPIHASPYMASLLWALSYVGIFFLIAAWMYRKKIFLKV